MMPSSDSVPPLLAWAAVMPLALGGAGPRRLDDLRNVLPASAGGEIGNLAPSAA